MRLSPIVNIYRHDCIVNHQKEAHDHGLANPSLQVVRHQTRFAHLVLVHVGDVALCPLFRPAYGKASRQDRMGKAARWNHRRKAQVVGQ